MAAAELSGSDSAALHDIGIDVRSMDAAEREAQLRKIGVFDDVPGEPVGSLVPTAGLANLKVAIGRLPVAATHDLVETFHSLFYDPGSGDRSQIRSASAGHQDRASRNLDADGIGDQAPCDGHQDWCSGGKRSRPTGIPIRMCPPQGRNSANIWRSMSPTRL